jgi:hypothetical protein
MKFITISKMYEYHGSDREPRSSHYALSTAIREVTYDEIMNGYNKGLLVDYNWIIENNINLHNYKSYNIVNDEIFNTFVGGIKVWQNLQIEYKVKEYIKTLNIPDHYVYSITNKDLEDTDENEKYLINYIKSQEDVEYDLLCEIIRDKYFKDNLQQIKAKYVTQHLADKIDTFTDTNQFQEFDASYEIESYITGDLPPSGLIKNPLNEAM